jgi:pimeloyl-ACP methyl ester carboxylesterase
MKGTTSQASDFIVPLNMDGLSGRMLHVPAPKGKSREILFIYGHHSSLERWWGVIQDLNQYGAVTVPDLPGFGGMESMYQHGEEPTIDNLADYLAAFVKLRYRRKRITIAGLSFGFVVVTRMLQRYPELVKKVDLLVSVVGFAHKDDFVFTRQRYLAYRTAAQFFSHKIPAMFFRGVFLHPWILKSVYGHTRNAKQKFDNTERQERRKLMNFEVHLWHCNDVRTYMKTSVEFLNLDNCQKQVNLPVWHISVEADRYFNNRYVEQHMRVIFTDFHEAKSKLDTHAPSVIADAKASAPLIPPKIRKLLKQ